VDFHVTAVDGTGNGARLALSGVGCVCKASPSSLIGEAVRGRTGSFAVSLRIVDFSWSLYWKWRDSTSPLTIKVTNGWPTARSEVTPKQAALSWHLPVTRAWRNMNPEHGSESTYSLRRNASSKICEACGESGFQSSTSGMLERLHYHGEKHIILKSWGDISQREIVY
jgi:hypothetical protein